MKEKGKVVEEVSTKGFDKNTDNNKKIKVKKVDKKDKNGKWVVWGHKKDKNGTNAKKKKETIDENLDQEW